MGVPDKVAEVYSQHDKKLRTKLFKMFDFSEWYYIMSDKQIPLEVAQQIHKLPKDTADKNIISHLLKLFEEDVKQELYQSGMYYDLMRNKSLSDETKLHLIKLIDERDDSTSAMCIAQNRTNSPEVKTAIAKLGFGVATSELRDNEYSIIGYNNARNKKEEEWIFKNLVSTIENINDVFLF